MPPYDHRPAARPARRRAPRRRLITPARVALVSFGLAAVVLAALRFVPGSPLAATAASGRGQPTAGASTASPPPTSPTPTASASPSLPPLLVAPRTVKINATGWWAWALLDMRTGQIYGSKDMASTSTTASMIKAWIAADYLRRAADRGETPSDARLDQITAMIRDSNNTAAETLFTAVGRVASIKRLISVCRLTESSPSSAGGWSRTRLSPRDTARMGGCIADGRAAGAKWTSWLLKEMRLVRGVGDFGIRKAFPVGVQQTIAIKNGWIDRTAEQEYHVSCLAIGDGWTMGVMTRYPIGLGYTYGAKICKDVASQLRNRP